jgi:hypothetical protein
VATTEWYPARVRRLGIVRHTIAGPGDRAQVSYMTLRGASGVWSVRMIFTVRQNRT